MLSLLEISTYAGTGALAFRNFFGPNSVKTQMHGLVRMIESTTLRLLRLILTKDFLLSLEDALRAEALKAHGVVRDHSGLKDRRRARAAEGQLRFRMMEERFEEICQEYGGQLLDGGIVPDTDLKVFQPFFRFVTGSQGFIFGLAAIPEPNALPPKNKSRLAGVRVNYHLQPGLFDAGAPKDGDIFVLLLVARDRDRAGFIEEMAIGIIDARYQSFVLYQPLGRFMSGQDDEPAHPAQPPELPTPSVSLKKGVAPYVPPELPEDDEKKDTGTK
ncbi:hypothetical protein [Xanthobacter flavus]|uniref:hypothetical protein n=1 Tax=Xanthobacter flavus TaxID=281 RepID=UPI00372AA16D